MTLFDAPPRPRRRPSLTPMIDVVFLLLVFFMLASRFGAETALRLPLAGAGAPGIGGAPRLVDVVPDGVRLNGAPVDEAALPARIEALTGEGAELVILRPREGASLQRLVDVAGALRGAGQARLAIVE